MKKYNFDLEPFARTYVENLDKTVSERIGLAMRENAKTQPISFMENCLLPQIGMWRGGLDSAGFMFCSAMVVDSNSIRANAERHPEYKEDLLEIADMIEPWDPGSIQRDALPNKYWRLADTSTCWGGTWSGHGNPDYTMYLHTGTNGIRAKIEECRKKNPGLDSFYNGSKAAMDALDIIAGRISAMAAEEAANSEDPERKAEFERISETYKRIPMEPAYDMFSATHMFWMYYTYEQHDSPGRYDQFMIDYWRVSSEEDNKKCLDKFLEAMHNVRGWNVCIAGSDGNWNDESNEITRAMLIRVAELGYQTPNLTLRVCRNTPDDIWELAAKSIGTGNGLPAIYNDEVVCPALEACGIPAEDAHDYCMNGCNQIDIFGKSHMGLEDGEVNLARVLEFTLHNGVSYAGEKPEVLSLPMGLAEECVDFDSFLKLYYANAEYITDMVVEASNTCQRNNAFYMPNPLRTCTIQGCLEKGRDFFNGGALYNDGQILLEGIADTADSIYAIKKLVYDEKKYTMAELKEALRDNFEGHEQLWKDFKNCDKFGNDIEEVDTLCAAMVDHVFKYFKTKKTFRGGVFTGGCSTFNRAAANGRATGALPNGRHKNDTNLADSIAATPGNDLNGPTASMKSMMHYVQTEACSGFVSQFKFDKSNFNTEKGVESFISLLKTYFENGGQQVSINVLDKETLLKAQQNPDEYRGLIVRVGGYSDYFCNLDAGLQQNIIDRSTFEF